MKKTLTIILALVLVMSIGVVPSAALTSSKETVTRETFAAKVKAEYAKYGIEYEVVKYGPEKVLTTKMLEDELARVDKIGKQYLKEREVERSKVAAIKKLAEEETNLQSPDVMPLSMPINKSLKYDKKFNEVAGYGNAIIRLQTDVTYDGGTMEFLSINKISSYQYGLAANFQSWTQTNKGSSFSRNTIYVWAQGRLSFQYNEPNTGNTITSTSDRELGCYWNSSDL